MSRIVFGSEQAIAILKRDKKLGVFGPDSRVGHELTTPVDLRIAPMGEPPPPDDLANGPEWDPKNWQEAK